MEAHCRIRVPVIWYTGCPRSVPTSSLFVITMTYVPVGKQQLLYTIAASAIAAKERRKLLVVVEAKTLQAKVPYRY